MTNDQVLARADKIFVGGVNSPVRSFKRVGGHPLIVRSAQGAFITDVEGKEYIDCVMSYGPHLFGHGHPPILKALQQAIDGGLCFGLTSEREIAWGERVQSFLPAGWKVRALSSGTEACMAAVRLARGYTGRDIIVKCAGNYHGHSDSLLFDAGSGVATLSFDAAPDSTGLTKKLAESVRVISYNDPSELERVFETEGDRIAGIILEPVMGNMGVVLPELKFLNTARALTSRFKSVLIFDEVMTGFRVGKSSAWGRFQCEPDLITFGKIIGGGTALAALTGRAEIMDQLAPIGKVYQAGTLSGNALGVSAGLAMLNSIEELDPYADLEKLGRELESAISAAIIKSGINACVSRCGSMMSIFFRKDNPANARECRDIDNELFKKFFWTAIDAGLMLPPSPFEAYFLSAAHFKIADRLSEVFQKVLLKLRPTP